MAHTLNTVPAARRVVLTNEQVTGPPATEMLRRSGISSGSGSEIDVLDNATGGGVLIAQLLKQIPHDVPLKRVVGGDIDEKMLSYAGLKKEESVGVDPRWSRVELMKIDQQV